MGLRTVCVAGNLENEYSEIGTWKQRTDVSQDDLLDTKLWLVSRKSVWSSSSWRPQICQTLRFVVCKTFEIHAFVSQNHLWWNTIADEVKMSADVVIWVNWSIERRFWYSPHHPPLGFVRLRLNRKTLPLKKDDIDVDEVHVDGNFTIWLPDSIGLPKYY